MYNCYMFGELLPVTPAKLQVKIKGNNSTVTLLNEGEVNILKYPGLTEITVPVTLPMLTSKKRPDYYLDLLEKAKTQRKTTQFILTRTTPDGKLLFDTNMKVSVEEYTITEDGKEGLDMELDVKLKQYRDYGTKKVSLKKITTSEGKSVTAAKTEKDRENDNAPKAKTYTVKSGDTLWGIAAKYLGSGAKYTEIFNANKDKLSNPNIIKAGQVLTIP